MRAALLTQVLQDLDRCRDAVAPGCSRRRRRDLSLCKTAHELKGLAATIGAMTLADIAGRSNSAATEKRPRLAPALCRIWRANAETALRCKPVGGRANRCNRATQDGRNTLLLVEDTPSLQMLYATVLRKAGYKPMLASSGAEALTKFAEHRPCRAAGPDAARCRRADGHARNAGIAAGNADHRHHRERVGEQRHRGDARRRAGFSGQAAGRYPHDRRGRQRLCRSARRGQPDG